MVCYNTLFHKLKRLLELGTSSIFTEDLRIMLRYLVSVFLQHKIGFSLQLSNEICFSVNFSCAMLCFEKTFFV